MAKYPRRIFFKDGKALGCYPNGTSSDYDDVYIMDIPSDHYDFLGMDVVGKTKAEIEAEIKRNDQG